MTLNVSVKEPLDFSFGQNEPSALESLRQLPTTSAKDAEMTDSNLQDGVPSWFVEYRSQQQQQTLKLQHRLNMLEEILKENKQLRSDLEIAQARIAELEANLPTDSIPTIALDKQTGTEASKWASKTITPLVAAPQQEKLAPSFAAVVKKTKTLPSKKKKTTAKQLDVIQRRFAPASADSGFEYIYLPSRYQEPVSSLRGKLRKLKINTSRVLDIHYPARQVVAFLIHSDYKEELLSAFAKVKVKSIADFDPLNPANLEKYSTYTF